ncbi:hypothetical protein UFOVP116_56 [uncultured Caudovirales phage]|uniref:Uncharacterized protein n=1 Tax=uncultured Caudovirales phage TaxID=2100421 RepID=A0A6J5L9R2_9CAUD|nr:hypothetical protein UFOVP116_56 [uncultured Caudovirales phage]
MLQCHTTESGDRYWRLNGKYHREDGPAIEYASGAKMWYRNGRLHREDGPAVMWAGGGISWFRNGKRYNTLQEFCEASPNKIASTLLMIKYFS